MKATTEAFFVAATFLVVCGIIALIAQGCNDGRNHGSNIPIDPTCVELVTDECVPEVIEEFCPECISETDIILRERHAYRTGFRDGVNSVVCETTDPVCEDDIDDDCEDDAHKKVHKRCKGNGHTRR